VNDARYVTPAAGQIRLRCRPVTVDCHSGAQSVFATALYRHFGGMRHLLTALSKGGDLESVPEFYILTDE
jgi:hypothetical protein